MLRSRKGMDVTEPNTDDTNQAADADDSKFVADSDAMLEPAADAKTGGPAAANRPPTETALAAAVLDVMNGSPTATEGGSSLKKLAIVVVANTLLAAATGALLVSLLAGRGTTQPARQPADLAATVVEPATDPLVAASAVPASWSSSQAAFDEGDFALALRQFVEVEASLPLKAGADPKRDLVGLRIGQCHLRLEQLTEARQQAVTRSGTAFLTWDRSTNQERRTAMDWYLTALKKYAVFSGRARRKEYWLFMLFNIIIAIVLGIVEGLSGGPGVLPSVYYLAVLIPAIAVGVRRLHDTNRSGWWLLLGLIPIVGAIVLLVFFVQDSQADDNQYGPSPKLAAG